MKDNQEYIVVQSADLKRDFPYRSNESLMRSLEYYLDTNKQSYSLVDGGYIIHVDGKNDAMRIGNDIGLCFGLNRVGYFNGGDLLILTIVDSKKKRTSRVIVEDTVSGENVSLKKYNEDTQKEIDQRYVSFKDISVKKIMSLAKLEKLVASGSLKEVNIGGKRYINRVELLNFLTKR